MFKICTLHYYVEDGGPELTDEEADEIAKKAKEFIDKRNGNVTIQDVVDVYTGKVSV